MKILAIETSCDETAAAVIEARGGKDRRARLTTPLFSILSSVVASQIAKHRPFGGVVPNLAKREHQRNLIAVLKGALREGGLFKISNFQIPISKQVPNYKEIKKIFEHEPLLLKNFLRAIPPIEPPSIDFIAVTKGPGLEPALWAGVNFARALSLLWHKPLLGVNHLEGHVYAIFLQKNRNDQFLISNFQFPALALIVSGGHTELVLIRDWLKYRILGETLDDAAGEAFDKVAKLLGLPYPGGPAVAAQATKLKIKNEKLKIRLPRPMIHSKDCNFSFSGLKTAVLYSLRDLEKKYSLKVLKPVIAHEFQEAVVEVLVEKTMRAIRDTGAKSLILGGGVAANQRLREVLKQKIERETNCSLFLPSPSLTTDNAAIIGAAAFHHLLRGERDDWRVLQAEANLRIR